MRAYTLLLAPVLVVSACASGSDDQGPSPTVRDLSIEPQTKPALVGEPEPPMLGMHQAHGAGRPPGGTASPLLTSHGGAILTSIVVQPIFWGVNWGNATFAGDKMTGLDSFYPGLDSSNYAATSTEYTGTNGTVGTSVTYSGYVVDLTSAPSHAPRTSDILAEVCRRISAPVANGYYPVYIDAPRGNAGYCAWHSYGTCNTVPIQFGFFFALDGDPGCDPQDTSGLHSQGLAALANVSGHEYSETITDPRNGGWLDSGGNENADKCAWTFGAPLLTLPNGTQWKIQGNWSNAAYTANTGYPNRSAQNGCLSGL